MNLLLFLQVHDHDNERDNRFTGFCELGSDKISSRTVPCLDQTSL